MAFIDTSQDPNQQNPQAAGAPGAGTNQPAPQTSSSTSNASAVGSAKGQGVTAQPAQSKAPFYQDLGAYLTANAPQVQNMASGIANNITQQGQGAQNAVDQASNQFNQAVQAGTVQQNKAITDAAASNPASFVQNPANVQEFQKELNASYAGPTDFTAQPGYNDINTQIQNAVSTAKAAPTTQGLQNLVASQEQNPTQGVRTLDSMLLNENQDSINSIQNAAKPFLSLGDYLTNATTADNQAAQAAQATTNATGQAVKDQFLGPNGVAPTFQSGLTSQLNDAQKAYQNYVTTQQLIQQVLGQAPTSPNSAVAGLSPDQIATIQGLNPGQFSQLEDINREGTFLPNFTPTNLGNFFQAAQVPGAPSLNTVASADEYAKDAALASLLGSNYNTVLDPTLASTAGSFALPTNTGSFNYDSADTNEMQNLTDAYNSALNNASSLYGSNPNLLSELQNVAAYLKAPPPSDSFIPSGPPYLGPGNGGHGI